MCVCIYIIYTVHNTINTSVFDVFLNWSSIMHYMHIIIAYTHAYDIHVYVDINNI
jgi:hypothetical protein